MLKNPKAKGSRVERKVKRWYEERGYAVCKSGGSLGLFDLIAIGHLEVIGIQCKSQAWPGPQERLALEVFARGNAHIKVQCTRWDNRKGIRRMEYDTGRWHHAWCELRDNTNHIGGKPLFNPQEGKE